MRVQLMAAPERFAVRLDAQFRQFEPAVEGIEDQNIAWQVPGPKVLILSIF
jgi:hypothetical protein